MTENSYGMRNDKFWGCPDNELIDIEFEENEGNTKKKNNRHL